MIWRNPSWFEMSKVVLPRDRTFCMMPWWPFIVFYILAPDVFFINNDMYSNLNQAHDESTQQQAHKIERLRV